MPRHATPIDQAEVWDAADGLLNEGVQPTAERVRQRLGRASREQVGSHLDTWFNGLSARLNDEAAAGTGGAVATAVPNAVLEAAANLWQLARSGAETDVRARIEQLEHDAGCAQQAAAASASALASTEQMLQQTQEVATSAQQAVSELQGELQARVAELIQVADARDSAHAEALATQVRLGQATTEIAIRDEQQTRLGAELAAVRQAHYELIQRGEEQIAASEAQLRQLEADHASRAGAAAARHEADLEAARQRHDALLQQQAAAEQQHQQRLNEAQQQHDALQAQHLALQEQHGVLQAQHATLQEEQQALQQQYGALEAQIAELQSQHDAIDAQHGALQEQHGALQAQHTALQSEQQALKQQREALEVQVGELQTQHAALEQQHAELEQTSAARRVEQQARHAAAEQALREQLAGTDAELDRVQQQAANLRVELAALARERDDLGLYADELEATEDSLRDEIATLSADLGQVRADAVTQVQRLQAALDERDHQLTRLVEQIDTVRTAKEAGEVALTRQTQQAKQAAQQAARQAAKQAEQHAAELSEQLATQQAALAEQHAAQLAALTEQHAAQLAAQAEQHTAQQTGHAEQHAALQAAHAQQLSELEARLTADIDRAREEAGQLYLKVVDLEQERDQYAQLGTSLAASDLEHHQALERAREQAAAKAAADAAEIARLRADYDTLERQIADHATRQSQEIGDAQQIASRFAARLEAAQTEAGETITLMSERIDALGADNQALTTELAAGRAQIEALQARLDAALTRVHDQVDADHDSLPEETLHEAPHRAAPVVATGNDADPLARLQAELDEVRGELWAKDAQCRTLMRTLAQQRAQAGGTPPIARRIERPRRAPSPRI